MSDDGERCLVLTECLELRRVGPEDLDALCALNYVLLLQGWSNWSRGIADADVEANR